LQEGLALSRLGKKEEAAAVFEGLKAGGLPEDLARVLHYELAWCYRALGQPERASSAYEDLLRLPPPGGPEVSGDPDLAAAGRLELAELHFDAGRVARAQELLEPLAGADGPLRERALYRLAWCQHRAADLGAMKKSLGALEAGFASSPRTSEIALALASALVEAKDFKAAAEIFARITERSPEPPEAELARVCLAECRNEEHEFAAAQTAAGAFLERYPESQLRARAHFARGWAREALGEVDSAIADYKQAIGTGAAVSARAQFQIGQCLASQKKYQDAVVEFLQVPARYSYVEWSSRALLQIAGCFEALDDLDRARKYYEEVLKTYADRDEARLARQRLAEIP
jgi:TolA-binding protein